MVQQIGLSFFKHSPGRTLSRVPASRADDVHSLILLTQKPLSPLSPYTSLHFKSKLPPLRGRTTR